MSTGGFFKPLNLTTMLYKLTQLFCALAIAAIGAAIVLSLLSCQSEADKAIERKWQEIDRNAQIIDSQSRVLAAKAPEVESASQRLARTIRYLDSNQRYGRKAVEYRQMRDEMEIMYLRTEEDSYRVRGNRYAELAARYGRKANAWYDSLQQMAKHPN